MLHIVRASRLANLFEERIWQVGQGRQWPERRRTRLTRRRRQRGAGLRCTARRAGALLLFVALLQELLQNLTEKSARLSRLHVEVDHAQSVQVLVELAILRQIVLVDLQQNFVSVVDAAAGEKGMVRLVSLDW